MMNTRRLVASAVAAAWLAMWAMAADPSVPGRPGTTRPAPTIEPTLPLLIDVRFEEIGRAAGGTSAVLVLEITGSDAISDLVLESTMPAGLRPVGPARLPRGPMGLARGEVRRFVLPVTGDGVGRHAVRIEAVFRDVPGRTLRLGQGATLDPSAPAAGRSHLGAYEMMAVPIEEMPR
jgi:hypothetical protein